MEEEKKIRDIEGNRKWRTESGGEVEKKVMEREETKCDN